MRIALLEDDDSQARLVERWLNQAAMTCLHYATGAAFRAGITRETVDLVIIDWLLPDDDGLAVLVWLRDTLGSKLPVMFTTTRAEEAYLVMALEQGADDYLIKPLRQSETIARIHALLRRGTDPMPLAVVTLGGIQIDLSTQRATSGGLVVELTNRELELAVLVKKPSRWIAATFANRLYKLKRNWNPCALSAISDVRLERKTKFPPLP